MVENIREIINQDQKNLLDAIQSYTLDHLEEAALDYQVSKESPRKHMNFFFKLGFFKLFAEDSYASRMTFYEAIRITSTRFPTLASLLLTQGIYGILPVCLYGTDQQKATYLDDYYSGKAFAALAATEKKVRAKDRKPYTRAKWTDQGWVLNGSKDFVSNGSFAREIFVLARIDQEEEAYGFFIVPGDAEGLHISSPLEKPGLKAMPVNQLDLEDVTLGEEALLGGTFDGHQQNLHLYDQLKLAISIQALGLSQGALDLGLVEMKKVRKTGFRLLDAQPTRDKLADYVARLDALSIYLQDIFRNHADNRMKIAIAKLNATETAYDLTENMIRMTGGATYMRGTILEILNQDAKTIIQTGGSSKRQREIIAELWLEQESEKGV